MNTIIINEELIKKYNRYNSAMYFTLLLVMFMACAYMTHYVASTFLSYNHDDTTFVWPVKVVVFVGGIFTAIMSGGAIWVGVLAAKELIATITGKPTQ